MADWSERCELVVSRYAEDVSWVGRLGAPAVVYDKSGAGGEHSLPNVGRESHTYLTHIVRRYPDFAEFTVFLQGDPFAHMRERTVEELRVTLEELVDREVPFRGLAYYRLKCDALGRPHHLKDESSRGKWAGFGRDIPVGEIYGELFSGAVPLSYHVRAPAGLLFVRRDRIVLRPRSLYERALELVTADPDDARNTGHAMERLWYLVFNGYAALNKAE